MKKATFVLSATVAIAFGLSAHSAFASHGIDRSIGSLRQEMRNSDAENGLVKIEGTLSCDAGAANSGQACDLKIRDNKTGRVYKVAQNGNGNAAMNLYQAGRKQVAIEAKMTDENSATLEALTVRSVSD